MGWMDKVKDIIERLRGTGKSKQEIGMIVQQAMDKATVTRQVEQAMTAIADGVRKMGESAEKARSAMDAFVYATRALCVCDTRKETNNWRRMHGLPMRRKTNRRKRRERGKRADNHPKNADVFGQLP